MICRCYSNHGSHKRNSTVLMNINKSARREEKLNNADKINDKYVHIKGFKN